MREAGLEYPRVLDASLFPEPLGAELFSKPGVFMREITLSTYATYWEVEPGLRPGRPRFCINQDPRVGAYALPNGSHPLITVNAGTFIRLSQLFNFVVLDREAFPEMPDETVVLDAERARFGVDPSSLVEPVDLDPRSSVDDCIHLFAPLPNTLRRRDLAQALYIAALDYVVLHELAHIVRRHDRFCEGPNGIYFGETPGGEYRPPSKLPALVRKIEADADLTAAYFSSHSYCRSGNLDLWRGWAESTVEALELWMFAIWMTIGLLGGWSEGQHGRVWYPHPSVRLALILIEACTVAEEIDIDRDSMGKVLRAAYRRASTAWARLGLPSDIEMLRRRDLPAWERSLEQAAELHDEVMEMMRSAGESRSS
jgi:hypothetical protein